MQYHNCMYAFSILEWPHPKEDFVHVDRFPWSRKKILTGRRVSKMPHTTCRKINDVKRRKHVCVNRRPSFVLIWSHGQSSFFNKIAYDILGEEMVLICLWWFFSGFSEGEMWLGPGMISCHLRKWLGLYMLYTWMITYGDPFKVTTLKERYQLAVGIFAMFWDNCSATSIHRWRVSQEINCLSRVFLSFVVVWRWNSPLCRPFFGDAKCHSYTWVLPPIPATNSCKFDSTYQYRLLQYFSWKLSYINIDFPQFLGCVSHAQEYVIFLGRITVIRSKATIKLMMVSG